MESPLPALITVNGSARTCRPRNAKFLQKYKHARTVTERQSENTDYIGLHNYNPQLIVEWSVADVNADTQLCGLSGSPTKVKKIENVVFQVKESKKLGDSDSELEELVKELMANHTIG